MPRRPWRALPIFPRTLLLLVSSLLLVQLVSVALVLLLPPPRPFFVGMSEIAAALAGNPVAAGARRRLDPDVFPVRTEASAPVAPPGMTRNAELDRELAARLSVPESDVFLRFRPYSGAWLAGRRSSGEFTRRHGDVLFSDAVVAAVRKDGAWRSVRTPDRPMISDWQWRWILGFALSALLMLPLAWLFARRLSLPIRRFAASVDRIGRYADAPPVTVEGPVELRVAAEAINGMQARIAGYLRERTAMVAAIAHDLRTPLARIAFRIEGAPESLREPVHADIQEMTAMIGVTLDYAKTVSRPGERSPVDVGGLLAQLVAQSREMGREVSLADGAPAAVTGDADALRRLFQNLVDNALKYGGVAELEVRREKGWLSVEVADRGPGLPEEMLEKVFEPFVRNDPSRSRTTGGVGLGLTIARSIARDHGGTLQLANRPGGGLVATVRLPTEGEGSD